MLSGIWATRKSIEHWHFVIHQLYANILFRFRHDSSRLSHLYGTTPQVDSSLQIMEFHCRFLKFARSFANCNRLLLWILDNRGCITLDNLLHSFSHLIIYKTFFMDEFLGGHRLVLAREIDSKCSDLGGRFSMNILNQTFKTSNIAIRNSVRPHCTYCIAPRLKCNVFVMFHCETPLDERNAFMLTCLPRANRF